MEGPANDNKQHSPGERGRSVTDEAEHGKSSLPKPDCLASHARIQGTERGRHPTQQLLAPAVAASAHVFLVLGTLWSHALISLQTDSFDTKQVFQYGLTSVPSLLLT